MMAMSPLKLNILGALLSVLLYKWAGFSKKVQAKSKLLELIKELPVLSVPQLIAKVTKEGKVTQTIVKGVLDASRQQYIESKILRKMKLLFVSIVNKKFQYQDMRQIYQTPVMERVASLMTLSSQDGKKLHILDTLNTNFTAAIEAVTNQQKDVEYDAAFNILSLLVYILGLVTRSQFLKNVSSDYYNSIYEERFILPKTTNIVFGKFQKVGDSIVSKGFKYIAKSKQALVRMLEAQLKVSNFFKYFSGFLLFLAIAWYLYTLTTSVMADVRKFKRDLLSRLKKLVVDRYSCKNCNTNLRNMILQPCNHLAICKDCLGEVSGLCPVCHNSFNNSVELYVS